MIIQLIQEQPCMFTWYHEVLYKNISDHHQKAKYRGCQQLIEQ